jgi:hypothetical protein
MNSSPRGFLAVVTFFAALAAASGCKRSGGPPGVQGPRPAAPGTLLATVTVAPLDRIVANVDALSRTLGLPFAGKDLLTTLAAQNGLPPEIVGELDGKKPVAVAYAALAAGQPAVQAVVVSARSAEAAERLLTALGQVSTENGVRRVQRPGGATFYVSGSGPTLVASTTPEGLSGAGGLAVAAAARPVDHDLMLTGFPEALAAWRGTDVRTALTQFRKEMVADQIAAAERRGGPVPGAAERVIWEAMLGAFVDPLAESVTDAVSLDLDPGRGVRLGFRVEPRPGTELARTIASPGLGTVDPALLAGGTNDPLVAVWAVGASSFWPGVVTRVLDATSAAGVKGSAELARRFEVLRPLLTGGMSGTARAGRAGLTAAWSIALQPGTRGPVVLDAIAGLATAPELVPFLGAVYGRQAPTVESRRERDTVRTELAFPVLDRHGGLAAGLKAIFGSATLTFLATASKGRLIATTGPEAGPQLVALGGNGAPRSPPPEIAAALAESKSQDGIFFFDVWAGVRPVWSALASSPAELAMLSMLPGVGQLKLPLVITYRGGAALGGELRIPIETLNNAAAVIRPFTGGVAR